MNRMKVLVHIVMLLLSFQAIGQYDEILVINPDFEGRPAQGTNFRAFHLSGWIDAAPYYFPGQTPPDVQPGTMEFFDVTTLPQNGSTYLGMVTRQNETWELVSQRLINPLEKGKCYRFNINMARSETYFSQLLNQRDTTKEFNFNKPIVLRIWGGRNVYEKRELLAESPTVSHTDWRNYEFEFHLKNDHDYLILEAFYKTPTLLPYNGNILLDNASTIIQVACPGEEPLVSYSMEEKAREEVRKKSLNRAPSGKSTVTQKKYPKKTEQKKADKKTSGKKSVHVGPKILKELEKNKISEGQTIKIKQLFFEADSSNFAKSSYFVLNEIFQFLKKNPNVVIEIGGHTNGIPGQKYCQTLSLKRAKAVAEYLYEKGIPEHRIIYKGYGKEKPIASNKTNIGRQKNQRVEIKILKVG